MNVDLIEKIFVTPQQRANALFARDVMWPSVPPANVVPKLAGWRYARSKAVSCQTRACFGGWVAVHPFFREQGVYAGESGEPLMYGVVAPSRVAERLFGDWRLFSIRRGGFLDSFYDQEPEPEGISDHEIVARRLEHLLANSIVTQLLERIRHDTQAA